MRRTTVTLIAFLAAAARLVHAGELSTAPIVFGAEIRPFTSLRVSNAELRVDVPSGTTAPVYAGSVEFRAMARTRTGGDVLLTVESPILRASQGAADPESVAPSLTVEGSGSGIVSGPIASGDARVVGRWSGSGQRTGSLQFRVEGLTPGTYSIPLHFVLSAP